MKASTFFLGLTTGAIAAAVTVLYSTPKSGQEIRSNVKTASSDWTENFHELKIKVNDLKSSVANLSKDAKEQFPDVVYNLKQSVNNWNKTADPTTEKLHKELAAIQETLDNLERSILSNQK